jgi:flagellar protein FlaG
MHPQHPQPSVELHNSPDFRDAYANSVQLRVSLWDFYLLFGNIQQDSRPGHVTIRNYQGIYLSPQQAKALLNVLQQNVQQYESAFGEIRLEPKGDTNIVQ